MFATTSVDLSGAISLAATNGSSTVGSFGGMSTGKTAASGAASLYPGLTGALLRCSSKQLELKSSLRSLGIAVVALGFVRGRVVD